MLEIKGCLHMALRTPAMKESDRSALCDVTEAGPIPAVPIPGLLHSKKMAFLDLRSFLSSINSSFFFFYFCLLDK